MEYRNKGAKIFMENAKFPCGECGEIDVRLVCRECDKIEELPLKIMVSGAVISCSECGSLIVETKSS